jgi:hypothetical protein
MIRMLSANRRSDHDSGRELSYQNRELRASFGSVRYTAIRKTQILATAQTHYVSSPLRLLATKLSGTARPELTLSEVDDRCGSSKRHRFDQRAAARQLYVITMCCDCEDIDFRHAPI